MADKNKILIGSDELGFPLKEVVKAHLLSKGYEVIDVGTDNAPVKGSKAIQKGEVDRAIIMCGTGMNVNITCNKHKGVRCGLVESEFTAEMSRAINNCNVMAMGARVVSDFRAKQMVDIWLNTEFTAGLPIEHKPLLEGMLVNLGKMEDENFK